MALRGICEKCKKLDPKIWIASYVLISAFLLYWYPPVQVSYFEINNATTIAALENQYRATLAQILGGGAVAIGIYFAWNNFKISQENLKVSQEGQITERFTRAIDQLGNPNLEIRLGGIYALERISKESKDDYWPIMEILTAYVRKSSATDENGSLKVETVRSQNTDSLNTKIKEFLDVQAVLTVIGRRRCTFSADELSPLDLNRTYLRGANLKKANLKRAILEEANLEEANLLGANLTGANLMKANLNMAILGNDSFRTLLSYSPIGKHYKGIIAEEINIEAANLKEANLIQAKLNLTMLDGVNMEGAILRGAEFKSSFICGANFEEADLTGANFEKASLEGADFKEANLTDANFEEANLSNTKNLSLDQLSKVKNLRNAKLDKVLEIPLKKRYPALFGKPNKD